MYKVRGTLYLVRGTSYIIVHTLRYLVYLVLVCTIDSSIHVLLCTKYDNMCIVYIQVYIQGDGEIKCDTNFDQVDDDLWSQKTREMEFGAWRNLCLKRLGVSALKKKLEPRKGPDESRWSDGNSPNPWLQIEEIEGRGILFYYILYYCLYMGEMRYTHRERES